MTAALEHERIRVHATFTAGQQPDQRDLPPSGQRVDRTLQRPDTTDLDHAVGAASCGQPEHLPSQSGVAM